MENSVDRQRVIETILSNLFSAGVITEAEPGEIKEHLDSLDVDDLLLILVGCHQLREEANTPKTSIYIKEICLN